MLTAVTEQKGKPYLSVDLDLEPFVLLFVTMAGLFKLSVTTDEFHGLCPSLCVNARHCYKWKTLSHLNLFLTVNTGATINHEVT